MTNRQVPWHSMTCGVSTLSAEPEFHVNRCLASCAHVPFPEDIDWVSSIMPSIQTSALACRFQFPSASLTAASRGEGSSWMGYRRGKPDVTLLARALLPLLRRSARIIVGAFDRSSAPRGPGRHAACLKFVRLMRPNQEQAATN
jgi:hypothetical protein